jgi:hypothetical protein
VPPRALAVLALSAALSLRFAAPAQAAPPPIEPTPVNACSPCITVVDRAAWDETVTVVDSPAHDEVVTVVDVPASTAYRTVVDRPASVVAHHDLVTAERTEARSVVVTPAHAESYQTWVSSGYTSDRYVDTSHWETTPGYWETTPGYTAYEPGYWGYEPGRSEYEPGYWGYEPGHYEYEPGHYEYEPGHYEYEPGHYEYEAGHTEWDCEWWGCYSYWVAGYSYWVAGYSYWVGGYSYWVSGYSYWVSGYSYWVSGYSYWVSGYSYWVPGYPYWVSGYSYWVPGSSYWVAASSTYVSSGYWTSAWIDTSHYETAWRWVDDVYATVYDLVPAVYSDWLEALPELSHPEAYTVPALTHDETVHVAALTHIEVVHHEPQTRQVQAALGTESRQSGPRALGTTAGGLSATSAVPPIVIPVISTVTVVDAAAWREAVTVVDVPARSETRAVVVAAAATVVHRDLVTPEATLTRTVVVTPETAESVTTWVSSGYSTSTYVPSGYWDTYNCRWSSFLDDEICSERYVDTSSWAYGWADTSHYETTTRTLPAVTATLSEVVPAVYDEWVEVVPDQVATETVILPAASHIEYVDRPAVTHTERLEYDAVVGGDPGSGGSDGLAGLAFLLGLSALAGAGRYASARDTVAGALAEWSRSGNALRADLAPLLAEVATPAADEHAWSGLTAQVFGPVDLTMTGPAVEGADVLSGGDPVAPVDEAPSAGASSNRLAELDAMLAIQAFDPWGPGGPLDESTRVDRRRTIADAKALLLGVTKLSGGDATDDAAKPWPPRRPGTPGGGSELGPFGMPSLGVTAGGLGLMGSGMVITPRRPNEGTIADPIPPLDPKGGIIADPFPPRDPSEGILGDPIPERLPGEGTVADPLPQRDPREGILADPIWQPGADDGVFRSEGDPGDESEPRSASSPGEEPDPSAQPNVGDRLYRIYGENDVGEGSGPYGQSWTSVDPGTMEDPRGELGLPDSNQGRFLVEGVLIDAGAVVVRPADPYPADADNGGLPEYLVPDPGSQIEITGVYGLNPEW